MRKIIGTSLSFIMVSAMGLGLIACAKKTPAVPTIGIIEPIEHKAMDEIVAGYQETLSKEYHQPVVIKIENAQNDPNLERAIIQKMSSAGYTMIVPIGTSATQMTLAMNHQPVVSLASDVSEADRKKLNPCQVAVVHDEIPVSKSLQFIHAMYPKLTHLTLIHSAADNVFPEVQEAIAAGKQYHIQVHHLMVSTLPELYSIANALPKDTQAIFILKDNMIVSGISTLAAVAENKHLPLITSDQGSVQGGAAIALGVHEREIGVQGALLTVQILQGKSACNLPIVGMKNLTVFVNDVAVKKEGISMQAINTAAKKDHYPVENLQQD